MANGKTKSPPTSNPVVMSEKIDRLTTKHSFDILYQNEVYKYLDIRSPLDIVKEQLIDNAKVPDETLRFVKNLTDLYQGITVRGFSIDEILDYTNEELLRLDKSTNQVPYPNSSSKPQEYLKELSILYAKDGNKGVPPYTNFIKDSIKVVSSDRFVSIYPRACLDLLHNRFHDTLGTFGIPVKAKSEAKNVEKPEKSLLGANSEFYNIEDIVGGDNNLNKTPQTPSKLNPNFSAIMINNPYLRIGAKNFLETATFFNCATTMEMTKSYPYFRAQMVVPTFVKNKGNKVFRSATVTQFLFGDLKEEEKTEIYKIFEREFQKEEAGEVYRKGATVDMSMFTMPQTFVNMDEKYIGHNSNQKIKPEDTVNRLNFVQDPTQPFMSIEKFDINIAPSAGLMSYKTGTMAIVLHDKARMQDVAPLIKPDLFGAFGAEIILEYGYKHMDVINERDTYSPIGHFINSSVTAEKYMIQSSNISLDASGKIRIDLGLALKGPTDMRNIRIYPNSIDSGTKTKLQNLSQSLNLLLKPSARIYVNDIINVDVSKIKAAIRSINNKIRVLNKYATNINRLTGIKPELINTDSINDFDTGTYLSIQLIKELRSRITQLENIGNANKDYRSNIYGNADKGYDPYWDLDLESKLANHYKNKKISSFKSNRNVLVHNPSITPERYITFGNLLTAIVGNYLGNSGRYDDIQLLFYTANSKCGEMSSRSLASMLIEKESLNKFLDDINAKNQIMTLEGLISSIVKDQIVNNQHISFGLADLYTDNKKSKKANTKDETVKKTQERLIKIYGIKPEEIESGLVDIDDAKFVMPIINFTFDTLTDPEKNPDKTILKISIFDKNDNPYSSLYNIYKKKINKEFDIKIKSIAKLYKEISNSSDKTKTNAFSRKVANLFQEFIKAGILTEDGNTGVFKIEPTKSTESIKRIFKNHMPYLIYGSENSPITNANVTTMQDQLLATSYIVNASKNNNTLQNRFDIDVPLKIMPMQVDIDMIGNPWASFGHMYFIDFETNTTLDNIYVVTGMRHSFAPGVFNTNLKLSLQESFGTFEQSGELFSQAIKSTLEKNTVELQDYNKINTKDFFNLSPESSDLQEVTIRKKIKTSTGEDIVIYVNQSEQNKTNEIFCSNEGYTKDINKIKPSLYIKTNTSNIIKIKPSEAILFTKDITLDEKLNTKLLINSKLKVLEDAEMLISGKEISILKPLKIETIYSSNYILNDKENGIDLSLSIEYNPNKIGLYLDYFKFVVTDENMLNKQVSSYINQYLTENKTKILDKIYLSFYKFVSFVYIADPIIKSNILLDFLIYHTPSIDGNIIDIIKNIFYFKHFTNIYDKENKVDTYTFNKKPLFTYTFKSEDLTPKKLYTVDGDDNVTSTEAITANDFDELLNKTVNADEADYEKRSAIQAARDKREKARKEISLIVRPTSGGVGSRRGPRLTRYEKEIEKIRSEIEELPVINNIETFAAAYAKIDYYNVIELPIGNTKDRLSGETAADKTAIDEGYLNYNAKKFVNIPLGPINASAPLTITEDIANGVYDNKTPEVYKAKLLNVLNRLKAKANISTVNSIIKLEKIKENNTLSATLYDGDSFILVTIRKNGEKYKIEVRTHINPFENDSKVTTVYNITDIDNRVDLYQYFYTNKAFRDKVVNIIIKKLYLKLNFSIDKKEMLGLFLDLYYPTITDDQRSDLINNSFSINRLNRKLIETSRLKQGKMFIVTESEKIKRFGVYVRNLGHVEFLSSTNSGNILPYYKNGSRKTVNNIYAAMSLIPNSLNKITVENGEVVKYITFKKNQVYMKKIDDFIRESKQDDLLPDQEITAENSSYVDILELIEGRYSKFVSSKKINTIKFQKNPLASRLLKGYKDLLYKGAKEQEFKVLEEKILESAKRRKLTINPTPTEASQEVVKPKAAPKKLSQP